MACASQPAVETDGDDPLDADTLLVIHMAEQISTRNSWSTLPSFVAKMNKKNPTRRIDARSLVATLKSVPPRILAQHGVWMHSFGKKYMPLIITNGAYRRAWSSAMEKKITVGPKCSCGAKT